MHSARASAPRLAERLEHETAGLGPSLRRTRTSLTLPQSPGARSTTRRGPQFDAGCGCARPTPCSSIAKTPARVLVLPGRGLTTTPYTPEWASRWRRSKCLPGRGLKDYGRTGVELAIAIPRAESRRPTYLAARTGRGLRVIRRGQVHRGAVPEWPWAAALQDPSHKPLSAKAQGTCLAG